MRFITLQTILIVQLCLIVMPASAQDSCLVHAHAHNDYKHKHPLQDALKFQFASIEADIFLKNGKLLVAHTRPLIGKHSLEELYFEPLKKICGERNGYIFKNASLIILIDIKTDGDQTYALLKPLLEKYKALLTYTENGSTHEGAVTVILTGDRPFATYFNDGVRYAFLDKSLLKTEKDIHSEGCLMASTKYSNVLRWKGKGEVPETEKADLIRLCESAHKQGRKARLWAAPENEIVWKFLLDCGVDLINTDNLERLNAFLKKR